MVFRVLLPPEENAFKDDLHEESVGDAKDSSRKIPHLDDLDGLGILRDEGEGDKPSSSVIMFRGRQVVGFGRTYERKKEKLDQGTKSRNFL